jgi:hypothetical protein
MKGKIVWLVFCYYGWELGETKAFASKISALKWILREQHRGGYKGKALGYGSTRWEGGSSSVTNEITNTDYWIRPETVGE